MTLRNLPLVCACALSACAPLPTEPDETADAGPECVVISVEDDIDGGLVDGDAALLAYENVCRIDGRLTISHVTSLAPLHRLVEVRGLLRIHDNPDLPNLDGLEGLRTVDGIEVSFCTQVASLVQLGGIPTIGQLTIQGMESLRTLVGLEGLTAARRIDIADNPALSSLAGLDGLTALAVEDIAGIRAPELRIAGNAALTDLDALQGLVSIALGGEVRIVANASLSSIDGLRNMATDEPFVKVRVTDNPALLSLDGLAAVTQLQDLFVVGNASLESLHGLSALSFLSRILSIHDNPRLPQCEADAFCALYPDRAETNDEAYPCGPNDEDATCP